MVCPPARFATLRGVVLAVSLAALLGCLKPEQSAPAEEAKATPVVEGPNRQEAAPKQNDAPVPKAVDAKPKFEPASTEQPTPDEPPEKKKERLSLEEEWRAYSRLKGAETKTLDRNLHVTSLSISGTTVADADLAELKNLPHVRELVITEVNPDKVTDAGFAHVAKLAKLEELVISSLGISDEACEHIGKLVTLRILNLSGTRVSDDGMKHLGRLTKLETLDVSETTVTGEGLARVAGSKGLVSLNLRGTRLRTDDLKVIGGFTQLRVLHLPAVQRRDDTNPNPVYARSRTQFDARPDWSREHGLAASPQRPNMLPPFSIDYERGLVHLAGLVNLKSVEMTRVFCETHPTEFFALDGEVTEKTPLTELKATYEYYKKAKSDDEYLNNSVRNMKRDGKGQLEWKNAKALVSVSMPELYQFLMRPSGALLEHIANYKNVTALNLSPFLLCDDDLKHLAKHTGLERLDLSGSQITAKGLAHLKGLPKLKYLNLRGANIGDNDIPAIREIKSLRDVVLSQTNVTEAGAETFRRGTLRAVYDPKQERPWWCRLDWRTEMDKIPQAGK